MANEIFYPEPFPQQPRRFVPIPAQGDQPPRYSPRSLYALVESWRPPDPQPQQRPLTVAPLSLTYGQQPPRYSTAGLNAVVETWRPPDPQPQQRRPTVPIPAQGDQPPRYSPVQLYSLVGLWRPPDPQPWQRPVTAPIPTAPPPPPPDNPPRYTTAALTSLVASWRPPDPAPQQRRRLAPIPTPPPPPVPANQRAVRMSVVLQAWPTGFEYHPQHSVPVVPIPSVPVSPPPVNPHEGAAKPFVDHVPEATERLRRHTDKVADIFNSLMGQGFIFQTGAKSYSMDLTGADGPLDGPTGTFNGGSFGGG